MKKYCETDRVLYVFFFIEENVTSKEDHASYVLKNYLTRLTETKSIFI